MVQQLWLFGTQLSILADETKTSSLYDFIEGVIPAGVETPLHLHSKYSEQMYVLEGELTIYTKEGSVVLGPGETFTIPKGTQHVLAASGSKPTKALTVTSPSGFARLIREIGVRKPLENAMDPKTLEKFMQLSSALGDEILGPPGSRPVN